MRKQSIVDEPEFGYVYVIGPSMCNGPVKIGKTMDNPMKRLGQIQGGSPVQLHVIGIKESFEYHALEKRMHQLFKDVRLHGEWFNANPSDVLCALEMQSEIICNEEIEPAMCAIGSYSALFKCCR